MLYIKTYGCQMNVYDSGKIQDLLLPHGFIITDTPSESDVIVINTCHIREKASEKLYAELGRLANFKRRKQQEGKDIIIVVAGCVAQAEGAEVVKRAPVVDIVVGPQSYHELPTLIERIRREKKWLVELSFEESKKFDALPIDISSQSISAFISIQEGCDKFCHFCCVPYTRGAEYSRSPEKIMKELSYILDSRNVSEVTLLGQNVNAYHGVDEYGNLWTLGRLLEVLSQDERIKRLRYTTSHPRDMNDELLFMIHKHPKIMPFIHLPVQSGSDKILKNMNRKHTTKEYLEIIEKFRAISDKIQFSSDFIVGYPGETEADFSDTLQLVKTVEYASAYSFKYSPRPGTPASIMSEQISEEVKQERLAKLQELLEVQKLHFNQEMLEQEMKVLLMKDGKKKSQWIGKTEYMQSVIVDKVPHGVEIGDIVTVKITEAFTNSMKGEIRDFA
ncbi:(Dimethylallyl)adenosine tRNA methylthiotransferase MiaB [Candidatus Fokinia solitaria]|uniref:tRNA-2-methylthio-N(6)-dimethylallyladenosine synthase n=2 Tax=Candidatus Fokinia solitaria TaxID=1802984 RepID=A0A2U8BTE0_9RICK|nr:(Dimethylallyl)adenosine tRNA methylthiotransferase MiaB [Candidatus Fokinia solitaria]